MFGCFSLVRCIRNSQYYTTVLILDTLSDAFIYEICTKKSTKYSCDHCEGFLQIKLFSNPIFYSKLNISL